MSYHLYYIDYFKTLFFLVGLQDERPLVFLPLHKSHMDYLLLTFVLVTRDIKVGNVGEISNKENHFIQEIMFTHKTAMQQDMCFFIFQIE